MAGPSEMDLRDYWRILLRRKWWVLSSIVAALAFAFVLNTLTEPAYRATVRIQITPEPSRSLLTGQQLGSETSQSDNLALYTAAELITNRKLIARVLGELHENGVLNDDNTPAAAQPWYRAWFRDRTASAGTTDARSAVPNVATGDEIDWLLANITVEPVRDTRLVNIHVDMPDPHKSEQVANTVADAFVQYQTEQRDAGSSSMITFLSSQLRDVRNNLQRSEQAAAFLDARTSRLAAEMRLAQLKAAADAPQIDIDHLPVQTPSLDALRKQLLDSETELAKAREIYKGRHPHLVLLESENEAIRNSIRNELNNAVIAARNEYTAALAREQSLTPSDSVARAARNPAALQSDIANNRELYNTLLTKLKDAQIAGEAGGPLVEVVEPAAATPEPVRPRKLLNFIVCLFAGTVLGTGLAFLREYMRRTIRTPQDVDDYLQLPVLGLIPKA